MNDSVIWVAIVSVRGVIASFPSLWTATLGKSRGCQAVCFTCSLFPAAGRATAVLNPPPKPSSLHVQGVQSIGSVPLLLCKRRKASRLLWVLCELCLVLHPQILTLACSRPLWWLPWHRMVNGSDVSLDSPGEAVCGLTWWKDIGVGARFRGRKVTPQPAGDFSLTNLH